MLVTGIVNFGLAGLPQYTNINVAVGGWYLGG